MSQVRVLTISHVDRSAKDSVIIHFEQPPFGRIHYLPGQYVTLRIELAGTVHFRSYSLCSSPRLDSQMSIGVRRVKGGLISNYLADTAETNMELEVMVPRGRFFLDNSVKEKRHIILLAGGSGITPLFSILRSTLFNEPESHVSLLLSDHSEEYLMLKAGIESLSQKFSDRLHVQFHLTSTKARLTVNEVVSFLQERHSPTENMLAFLCGPVGLMEIFQQALIQEHVPPKNIHQELFVENVDEQQRRDLVDGMTRQVKLALRGKTYEFSVPPGSTVLDAAMDRGISVPHSCKQGTCASCLASLSNGTVVMAKKGALLDFEREQGKILTCQAQPTSNDVFITFS